jgi:hypothetical protein
MQAMLTKETKNHLKYLVELQTYVAEAESQLPALQDKIAADLFGSDASGFQSLKFGDLVLTCERQRTIAWKTGATLDMSRAQIDYLVKDGVLSKEGLKISLSHYEALPDTLKKTLEQFFTTKTLPATITVTGQTK